MKYTIGFKLVEIVLQSVKVAVYCITAVWFVVFVVLPMSCLINAAVFAWTGRLLF